MMEAARQQQKAGNNPIVTEFEEDLTQVAAKFSDEAIQALDREIEMKESKAALGNMNHSKAQDIDDRTTNLLKILDEGGRKGLLRLTHTVKSDPGLLGSSAKPLHLQCQRIP
jgi:DNA anti-recombination protein RmuC